MGSIFLAYHQPTGATKYAPLETANEPIFYLPAGVEDEIVLETARPSGRSDVAQIELISSMPFLCAYGKEICNLILEGQDIAIPTSTDSAIRFVLLRDGDQFETSAGRWSIERDDEQGTIQNSMRPPPLPEPPVEDDLEPLGIAQQEQVGPLPSIPISLAEDPEDSFVEDVPYSDDTPPEDKKEPVVSTVIYESGRREADQRLSDTQESSRNILHEALDSMADRSCKTTKPPDQPTHAESEVAAESVPQVDHDPDVPADNDAKAVFDASPQKRKRGDAGRSDKTYKRRKVDTELASVKVEEAGAQPEVEETIVVAAPSEQSDASRSSSGEESPSPPKKAQKGGVRKRGRVVPISTPVPSPIFATKSPSPTASSAHSTRSHRSQSKAEFMSVGYKGTPVICFASNTVINDKRKTMGMFEALGGKQTESIKEATVLCVGGELKKTEKLLLAILRGIHIVTEDWVVDATRNKRFADPSNFLPEDKKHEQEWGFRLQDAIQASRSAADVLAGKTVYISAQFKSEQGKSCTQSISNLAKALGAKIGKAIPKNEKNASSDAFAIGLENDREACQVGRLGMKMYDKELLTSTILRGRLNLDSSEYAVTVPVKEEDEQ